MGLSAWLFGRPKSQRPRSQDRPGGSTSREAWQQADMAEALRTEEHLLSDTADVSAGSRGYSLHALERAGFLRVERVARTNPMETGAWRFTRTPRGRELEAKRAASRGEVAAPASPISGDEPAEAN